MTAKSASRPFLQIAANGQNPPFLSKCVGAALRIISFPVTVTDGPALPFHNHNTVPNLGPSEITQVHYTFNSFHY